MIRTLDVKPAVVGHSFGGLLTEILGARLGWFWRNETPFAESSSRVFWQSAVSNTPPKSEPFATSARTTSASSGLNSGGAG